MPCILLPILDYADSYYLDITEDHLNKLEWLLNVCIRFITLAYLSLNMSQNTTWLIIRHRSNLHILSLHYFIIHNPFTPTYLKKWFNLMGANMISQLQLRLRSDSQLMLPTTHTRFYGDFFSKKAVQLWNMITS